MTMNLVGGHWSSVVALFLILAVSSTLASAMTVEPSSGLGKFDARLSRGTLTITLRVHYTFLPGDALEVPGFSMDRYYWEPKATRESFKRAFADAVDRVWSGKFRLRRDKRHVAVRVEVRETPNLNDAHWQILASHYPPTARDPDASVCFPETVHYGDDCADNAGKSWGTVRLANTHALPAYVLELEIAELDLEFERGTTDLVPESSDFIDKPIVEVARERGWRVRLTGYADADEVDPVRTFGRLEPAMRLAGERTTSIKRRLESAGIPGHRIRIFDLGATEEYGPYVRLEVFDPDKTIDTLAHEAGHMLGLGDEARVDCSGEEQRLPTRDYAAMVFLRADGELLELTDDDGIMSRGSVVRPWHYAPFVEAMSALGEPGPWQIVP